MRSSVINDFSIKTAKTKGIVDRWMDIEDIKVIVPINGLVFTIDKPNNAIADARPNLTWTTT